jgi:hypothetical protein
MAPEYAKERVWQKDMFVFEQQNYIGAKQAMRIARLQGKVDVIVTDAPLIMNTAYVKGYSYEKPYIEMMTIMHNSVDHLDVFVKRVKPYLAAGRHQDEAGAKQLDGEILDILKSVSGENYITIDGSKDGYDGFCKKLIEDVRTRIANS